MPFSAASSSFPGGGGALKQKQIGKNETSYLGTYYPHMPANAEKKALIHHSREQKQFDLSCTLI